MIDVCHRGGHHSCQSHSKWALPLLLVHREAHMHLIQTCTSKVTLTCRSTAVPAGGMLRTWLWYSKPCSCPDCMSPSLPRTQLLADVCEPLPLLSTQYLGLCFFSQREQKPEPLPHPLLHIGSDGLRTPKRGHGICLVLSGVPAQRYRGRKS